MFVEFVHLGDVSSPYVTRGVNGVPKCWANLSNRASPVPKTEYTGKSVKNILVQRQHIPT